MQQLLLLQLQLHLLQLLLHLLLQLTGLRALG